ncbi:hypothetical protein GTW43_01445 [Streptomyces sp. SID5785]|uniref:hypothetical protein n=1 Tax=Streptomyces sp. SID5785 TaxID=2690309 RepID=UPI0013613696|nr:hypothetical protein [Streptomyces sp. SID5785]MZD03748.1 hypothetical protein [Streptomyces sp. SID5785]
MTDRIPYLGRVCPNCDGFPVVAVSSGLCRDDHGHLHTMTVTCTTCRGTGCVKARRVRISRLEVAA